ncbi:hypothetical protein KC851_02200 [Candidatus Kaiserbacteria bacterium]|nr:hypothetical protein [Candidatus Kaiserbacteria bacterium]
MSKQEMREPFDYTGRYDARQQMAYCHGGIANPSPRVKREDNNTGATSPGQTTTGRPYSPAHASTSHSFD